MKGRLSRDSQEDLSSKKLTFERIQVRVLQPSVLCNASVMVRLACWLVEPLENDSDLGRVGVGVNERGVAHSYVHTYDYLNIRSSGWQAPRRK